MKVKSLFGIILFVAVSLCTRAQGVLPQFVSFSPESDGVSLVNATIGYSQEEYEGVKMAIQNLREDMKRVLGKAPVGGVGGGFHLDRYPRQEQGY